MSSYLERNPTPYQLEPVCPEAVHYVLIPVFDENDFLPQTLSSLQSALRRSPEPAAVVLILNEPRNCSAAAYRHNRELLNSLQKNDGKYNGGLIIGKELFYINLLDKDIPDKFRTVGNARKIGFDAVIKANDGKVTAKNRWLFSLDADTLISEDYFAAAWEWIKANPAAAGAVFHFEHRCDGETPAVVQAAVRYEIFLRDYAWKLRSCGSAYGFWTIGSAFMCNALDYMRCGGMRRNAAGEDFYFLQALRKTGYVGVVPGGCVYPAGRLSERVPFGTGPAIASDLSGRGIKLYHPGGFELLAEFFGAVNQSSYEQLTGIISLRAPELLQEFFRKLNILIY